MSDDSTPKTEPLRSRLQGQPLWDFALALYARPGVESDCLALQDAAGVDVCELLWHCWLFHHGAVLAAEPPPLVQVRRWQREVTRPLRALRRHLKPEAQGNPGVAEVRQQIQRCELAAERETLTRLQRLVEADPSCLALVEPPRTLSTTLAARWQLQEKSQLMALKRLECQLDPP